MKTAFLVLSTIVTFGAVLPYLRDIIRGTTKPNLVSWMTWTLLTGIATAAAIDGQEYVAAVFTGSATIGPLLVVLFGLKHGYVKYSRFDVVCQLSAIVGILLWQLFNSPSVGVVSAVAIDFLAALPTLRHAWLKPHEETWQAFAITILGGGLALFALETYNWTTLPYAIYLIVVNALLSGVIIQRRHYAKP